MTGKPVRGDMQPATPEGFAALVRKANDAYEDGLMLVGVVPVGPKLLGAVFVRMAKPDANLMGE